MGAQRLAEQDPEARPETFVPSPAPRCHAWAESVRRRFTKCYRAFQDRYRSAASRVRQRPADKPVVIMAEYPPGAMIRAHWHKPGPADLADAWLSPRGCYPSPLLLPAAATRRRGRRDPGGSAEKLLPVVGLGHPHSSDLSSRSAATRSDAAACGSGKDAFPRLSHEKQDPSYSSVTQP
jgi:hypothetical protein